MTLGLQSLQGTINSVELRTLRSIIQELPYPLGWGLKLELTDHCSEHSPMPGFVHASGSPL